MSLPPLSESLSSSSLSSSSVALLDSASTAVSSSSSDISSSLSPTSSSDSFNQLVSAYQIILSNIPGINPTSVGLSSTPERAARALQTLTAGYSITPSSAVGDGIFPESCSEMVLVRDVPLFSLCEHHLLPFTGTVHMAYLPNGKVLGLSKLVRLAEIYARRLQVQERLTTQIAEAIEEAIQPKGVAVFIEASHLCMTMRGVQKPGASTITSSMKGAFQTDLALRQEFFTSINYKR
jgi:GTP cyclohydrolase I